ncbi:MAG TPA: DUF5995 family protein [Myxococcaceae bacterium]|jgi:hypothetical protein
MSLLSGVQLHPRNVGEALKSLETVTERLRMKGDPRAVFPDVYGIITRIVAREIEGDTGFFQEPEWISRLAGRFCERYLETLAWSQKGTEQDCRAWGLSYGLENLGLTFPLQDAAFGISAHINYDLALGLWKTIEEFGDLSERQMARYKHDHDAVNLLLAAALPQVVACLRERYGCAVTERFTGRLLPVTGAMAMSVVRSWREQVWQDVLALVFAEGPHEQVEVLTRIRRRSGRWADLFAMGSLAGCAWRALSGQAPVMPPELGMPPRMRAVESRAA